MDERRLIGGDDRGERMPSMWGRVRERLLTVIEGVERAATTPMPCQRCGIERTWQETWAATRAERPFYAIADYADLLSLCPACFEIAREERLLKAQRAEEERALLAQQAGYPRDLEAGRVQFHLDRAREQRRPATLTVEQWMRMLNRHEWRCAYCEDGPYEALEHTLPLALGGGTTEENCVPACRACNSLKAARHPDAIIKMALGLQRVYRIATLVQGPGVVVMGAPTPMISVGAPEEAS